MFLPMPILDKPIWNYDEERYKRMLQSSYSNKKERVAAFRHFVSEIERLSKSKECELTFDKNKMSAKLVTPKYDILVKYIEMNISMETSTIGEYKWLDQDFFSVHIIGQDICYMFDAYDVKRETYLETLGKIF